MKEEALKLHNKLKGKIEIRTKLDLKKQENLKLAYTPGVAYASIEIKENEEKAYDLTWKGNSVAIVSNGTRLLGLGNAGPLAALPVMEGKAALLKSYAGINAVPLCVDLKTLEELENFCIAIHPTFGAINLEDINTEIVVPLYEILSVKMPIPIFHDDRHGTGIVVLAALINATKVLNKDKNMKIVIYGAGSAGLGITEALKSYGFNNLVVYDSKGIIDEKRQDIKNTYKELFLNLIGEERDYFNADVLIATSGPGTISEHILKNMKKDAIIFTLSNPNPDVPYEISKKYGAIIATGRSDLPNQVNNVLAFPGFFKALLKYRIKKVNIKMITKAAEAIALTKKEPNENEILPKPYEKEVIKNILKALKP